MGCSEDRIEYVPVVPDLPADLRTPVDVPMRKAETLSDVGVILTDHVEALETANGKITATDCIWTAAEDGRELAEGECLPEAVP
jgi:hypothetical protein